MISSVPPLLFQVVFYVVKTWEIIAMKMMQQKDKLHPAHTTSYDYFLMNNHAKLKNFLQNKLPRDFMFENPPLSKDDPFGRKVLGKFRFGTQCNTSVPLFNKKGTLIFVELNAPLEQVTMFIDKRTHEFQWEQVSGCRLQKHKNGFSLIPTEPICSGSTPFPLLRLRMVYYKKPYIIYYFGFANGGAGGRSDKYIEQTISISLPVHPILPSTVDQVFYCALGGTLTVPPQGLDQQLSQPLKEQHQWDQRGHGVKTTRDDDASYPLEDQPPTKRARTLDQQPHNDNLPSPETNIPSSDDIKERIQQVEDPWYYNDQEEVTIDSSMHPLSTDETGEMQQQMDEHQETSVNNSLTDQNDQEDTTESDGSIEKYLNSFTSRIPDSVLIDTNVDEQDNNQSLFDGLEEGNEDKERAEPASKPRKMDTHVLSSSKSTTSRLMNDIANNGNSPVAPNATYLIGHQSTQCSSTEVPPQFNC